MLKFLVKALACAVSAVLVYNYVILPITVPKLLIRDDWTEDDLKWRENDIFWFIHVTDLHISKYVHPDIKSSLEGFFTNTLDAIKPKLVLASGDLTDGKDKDGVDSFQILEEWETYSHLLEKHRVEEKTIYLDIRGNHDNFDVHHHDHHTNLHRNFSAKGDEYPSSYVHDFEFNGKTYSFFALDATLKTGPKKVFNFLGEITQEDLDAVLKEKQKSSNNKQIFFGHYPSSCIVSPGSRFREILQGGLVYLSGHLHTLGGLAPQLYSIHRGGTPELELGDWKENRKFRVLAVDNGILSFSDNIDSDWPVVVVTNPKDAQFLAPQVEPVQKIRQSSEIRILAFSPANITSVKVKVNEGEPENCVKHPEVPDLYVLPWQPDQLTGRNNHLTVYARDGQGNKKTVKMKFQVEFNEIENKYNLYARMILMSNVISVAQALWILSILVSVLPLYLARNHPSVLREFYSVRTSSKLQELSSFSPFYYLYTGTAILVGFGPWHVGEVLTNHTGIIFPWATVVAGQILPSFYPYIFSFVHMFFFHTPLRWSLLYKFKWRVEGNGSKLLLALSNIPVTLVLASQASLLLILFYYPSKLGIFREICLLIAPMELTTIAIGFVCNGLVSYYISETRRINK